MEIISKNLYYKKKPDKQIKIFNINYTKHLYEMIR